MGANEGTEARKLSQSQLSTSATHNAIVAVAAAAAAASSIGPPPERFPSVQSLRDVGKEVGKEVSIIKKLFSKVSFDNDDGNKERSMSLAHDVSLDLTTSVETPKPPLIPLYYELNIRLKEGRNLAVRDIGGEIAYKRTNKTKN